MKDMEKAALSACELVDAKRAALVMAELSYDLQRAVRSGVAAALRDVAADLGPERLAGITQRILDEIGARYRANAAATIMAI